MIDDNVISEVVFAVAPYVDTEDHDGAEQV